MWGDEEEVSRRGKRYWAKGGGSLNRWRLICSLGKLSIRNVFHHLTWHQFISSISRFKFHSHSWMDGRMDLTSDPWPSIHPYHTRCRAGGNVYSERLEVEGGWRDGHSLHALGSMLHSITAPWSWNMGSNVGQDRKKVE